MIGRVAAREDHGRKIGKGDLFFAEIFRRYALNMNKRSEIYLQVVLFRQFSIGVLIVFRLWQGNQYAFNLFLSIFQNTICIKPNPIC